jgi:hypothetical protein
MQRVLSNRLGADSLRDRVDRAPARPDRIGHPEPGHGVEGLRLEVRGRGPHEGLELLSDLLRGEQQRLCGPVDRDIAGESRTFSRHGVTAKALIRFAGSVDL